MDTNCLGLFIMQYRCRAWILYKKEKEDSEHNIIFPFSTRMTCYFSCWITFSHLIETTLSYAFSPWSWNISMLFFSSWLYRFSIWLSIVLLTSKFLWISSTIHFDLVLNFGWFLDLVLSPLIHAILASVVLNSNFSLQSSPLSTRLEFQTFPSLLFWSLACKIWNIHTSWLCERDAQMENCKAIKEFLPQKSMIVKQIKIIWHRYYSACIWMVEFHGRIPVFVSLFLSPVKALFPMKKDRRQQEPWRRCSTCQLYHSWEPFLMCLLDEFDKILRLLLFLCTTFGAHSSYYNA